jgi:hypothetical protein
VTPVKPHRWSVLLQWRSAPDVQNTGSAVLIIYREAELARAFSLATEPPDAEQHERRHHYEQSAPHEIRSLLGFSLPGQPIETLFCGLGARCSEQGDHRAHRHDSPHPRIVAHFPALVLAPDPTRPERFEPSGRALLEAV